MWGGFKVSEEGVEDGPCGTEGTASIEEGQVLRKALG